jgi:hypothetical protein
LRFSILRAGYSRNQRQHKCDCCFGDAGHSFLVVAIKLSFRSRTSQIKAASVGGPGDKVRYAVHQIQPDKIRGYPDCQSDGDVDQNIPDRVFVRYQSQNPIARVSVTRYPRGLGRPACPVRSLQPWALSVSAGRSLPTFSQKPASSPDRLSSRKSRTGPTRRGPCSRTLHKRSCRNACRGDAPASQYREARNSRS